MLPSKKVNRVGQVACGCKTILFHIREGYETCSKLEQLSVYCHCNDCVEFPLICYQAARNNRKSEGKDNNHQHYEKAIDVVNHEVQGANHVFVFKKNVTLVQGGDHLGWHKLFYGTETFRFYCKQCGTPLGFLWEGNTAFYGPLIQKRDDVEYSECTVSAFPEPYYAFSVSSAPEGSAKLDGSKISKYESAFPFLPMAHFMARTVLGSIMGLNKGTFHAPTDDKAYSVGRTPDSITLS